MSMPVDSSLRKTPQSTSCWSQGLNHETANPSHATKSKDSVDRLCQSTQKMTSEKMRGSVSHANLKAFAYHRAQTTQGTTSKAMPLVREDYGFPKFDATINNRLSSLIHDPPNTSNANKPKDMVDRHCHTSQKMRASSSPNNLKPLVYNRDKGMVTSQDKIPKVLPLIREDHNFPKFDNDVKSRLSSLSIPYKSNFIYNRSAGGPFKNLVPNILNPINKPKVFSPPVQINGRSDVSKLSSKSSKESVFVRVDYLPPPAYLSNCSTSSEYSSRDLPLNLRVNTSFNDRQEPLVLSSAKAFEGKLISSVEDDTNNYTAVPKLKKAWLQRHAGSSSGLEGSIKDTRGCDGTNVPKKRVKKPKSDEFKNKRIKPEKEDTENKTVPKISSQPFLQNGPCFLVAPKLAKCRECRYVPDEKVQLEKNIFCRFYAFRKLRYTKGGSVANAGFSHPVSDSAEDDLKIWLPPEKPPKDLDKGFATFLLRHVGDHLCDLVRDDQEAVNDYLAEDKPTAWKRIVKGVREMCDVCETTIFNYHWTCRKCGFVACIDCYVTRKEGNVNLWGEESDDKDEYSWLYCTNKTIHEFDKMMLTQIIPSDAWNKLNFTMHQVRAELGIQSDCDCPLSRPDQDKNSVSKDSLHKERQENEPASNGAILSRKTEESDSSLSWLADVALSKNKDVGSESDSDDKEDRNGSTLRELLIRPVDSDCANKLESAVLPLNLPDKEDNNFKFFKRCLKMKSKAKNNLKHFVRRYQRKHHFFDRLPIRIMILSESTSLYPDVPHSWLCDGRLLRLHDSTCSANIKMFQDQWERGQPVLVSGVERRLNMELWTPDAFSRDFGHVKNDLINCMTGNIVPKQPMRRFWEGFQELSKCLKDDKGDPMILKLKDWPPGEDFAEMLPDRYHDLMRGLPMVEYTMREGRLNLVSRLPEIFVKPDLGPKMYIAYGVAHHPSKGTTNLHLDVSDAVNVMVYVCHPKDKNREDFEKEALRAIDEAGCDILTRRRVRETQVKVGALWHVYNPGDADKIRDLLNKVAIERGEKLEPHHDPIHDQSWYLDGALRERLYKEYAVEGYALAQCLGDAVFIPAGAPHQVRNLHNCIKVAEDFISPENIGHCFHLTQEFRRLSETHTNHEDKLQIKNVIFHTMKDVLSVLADSDKNVT